MILVNGMPFLQYARSLDTRCGRPAAGLGPQALLLQRTRIGQTYTLADLHALLKGDDVSAAGAAAAAQKLAHKGRFHREVRGYGFGTRGGSRSLYRRVA